MKRILFYMMSLGLLAACQSPSAYIDNMLVAQIGDFKLSKNEVRSNVPIGLNSADSLAFVNKFVHQWVEEHLIYMQGLRNVRNYEELQAQVEEYRRTLISQTYENQLLESHISNVSTDEIWSFYETHTQTLRLEEPIVQGLFIKVLATAPQLDKVRGWVKDLSKGRTDCIQDLEQYSMQHAIAYDSFFNDWVNFQTLQNNMPAAVADAKAFLSQNKSFEASDDTYIYFLVIKDYRQVGQQQPYEYAVEGIRHVLLKQKREAWRETMHQQLYDEAVKNGTVVFF